MALKFHPDKNPSTEANDKFQEVLTAFRVLSDCKFFYVYNLYCTNMWKLWK